MTKQKIKIPKGWKMKKLKELLDYERPDKYIVKSTEYQENFKTPVLTANKSFVRGYTNEEFGICRDLPVIIFDDFTTDSKYVDFPFKVKSSAIKILRSKSEYANLKFLFEIIKSIHFPVGNHKRYYISEYQDIDVAVPPWNEQKKIAEILSKVDEDIEKTERVIKNIEKLKRGLMQELFGKSKIKNKKSKLQFKIQNWKEVKLGNKVKLFYGSGLPKEKRNLGEFSVYGSNGIVGWHENYLIKGPGIIIGRKGSIGSVIWSASNFWPIDTAYYIENDKDIYLRWLYYELQTLKLNKMNSASGVPGLNREEVYRLKIIIPSKEEQKQIAEILSSVDDKIEINKQIKNKLTQLKKGLMQDLLSGLVRTN